MATYERVKEMIANNRIGIGLDWKKPEQFDFKKWMNTTLKPAAH